MALIPCPNCKHLISDKAHHCPKCKYLGPFTSVTNTSNASSDPAQPTSDPGSKHRRKKKQKEKKGNGWILPLVIVALLLIGGGVGGWFYYNNIYLPKKIDAEAPRYYSFAHILNLRSSMSSGADFNKIAELPYGTELITYNYGPEWSRVKVSTPNYNGEQMEGYVSSGFILNKHDFFLLNSIFGDTDSKVVISTCKCRVALLNYFKENDYIGKISSEDRLDADIYVEPNASNQWQVFSKAKTAKYNSVYYKRLVNPDSKFTDFAVIIQNVADPSIKKLLYFTFDDDETPHLYYEEDVPTSCHYIKQIERGDWGGNMVVTYSQS
jgi:hypothetical protein